MARSFRRAPLAGIAVFACAFALPSSASAHAVGSLSRGPGNDVVLTVKNVGSLTIASIGRLVAAAPLKGASFKSCRKSSRSLASGAGAQQAARRRIRRLRGRGRGRFRVRGRYSSATVRGTDWTVTDRCDGTLTTVKSGRVAVRDLRRKKTVIVRAGKRYLARATR